MSEQSDYQPRRPNKGTQCATVLELLEEAYPDPVGLDVLMRKSCNGAVHSSVAKLRKPYGWRIENLQQRMKGRRIRSSYRLLSTPDSHES